MLSPGRFRRRKDAAFGAGVTAGWVLTGQVTEQCLLYSALDAYVRHFEVAVPRDAVASIHRELGGAAWR